MAISFTCPFCNEAYNNLKEELIGKRVTCRNINCRKVFVVKPSVPVGAATATGAGAANTATADSSPSTPAAPAAPKPPARQPIKPAPIPKPNAPVPPAGPVDAEALALAAFTEEVKKLEVEQKKIQVTCTVCDHQFEVNREMEGRNVPCPECRKLIKVPLQKKEEPVDWRKDRPAHLKQDLPELEGVSKTTGVSEEVLRKAGALPKVVYEPLPLSTRVKRFLIVAILVGGMGFGIFHLLKSRNQRTEDKNVTDAVNAIEKGEESKGRLDLQAGIFRLAAEERIRTAKNNADLLDAIKLLNTARNQAFNAKENYHECQALLVEIAVTYCSLGGNAEELDRETRLKWDDVQKEVRRTLDKVNDPELRFQGVLRVARKLGEHREAGRAVDIAKQINFPTNVLPEIAGRVGLELVKMGQKDAAKEFLRKKIGPMVDAPTSQTAPALTALRIALGTTDAPEPLNDLKVIPRPGAGDFETARLAWVEGFAYAGDFKTAGDLAKRPGNAETKIRSFLAAGEKALADNAKEPATSLLEEAHKLLMLEGKSSAISPWLKVRAVYLVALAGKPEQAGELANTLDKEMQPWARVELLRGRLQSAPTTPAQEEWLPAVPENTKPRLAHAVARELFARHQAANGLSTPVDALSPMLKPFAQLGTLLGSANRGTSP